MAEETSVLLSDIKSTLETMRTILEIQARPALRAEINALASSSGRRKMWILSDGESKTAEMAQRAGLKLRAAEYFVEDGVRAGLLVLPKRAYPKRRIDFIPADWEEITMLKEEASQAAEAEKPQEDKGNEGGASGGEP